MTPAPQYDGENDDEKYTLRVYNKPLQSIFWICGIGLGLISIAASVYRKNQKKVSPNMEVSI